MAKKLRKQQFVRIYRPTLRRLVQELHQLVLLIINLLIAIQYKVQLAANPLRYRQIGIIKIITMPVATATAALRRKVATSLVKKKQDVGMKLALENQQMPLMTILILKGTLHCLTNVPSGSR